jgi:GT2 family glycosyltransferase
MPLILPSSESPELSIVVMLTHDPALAHACLTSVAAAAESMPAAETIVVLGAASREVKRVLADEFSGASVIDSPVNTGTAVGWQLGFTLARGEFVQLLHEDAQLLGETVPRLLATLRAEPTAAVAGPWLEESGPNRSQVNAGVMRIGSDSHYLRPELLPAGLADAPYAVDEVSSAVSLWRREAWAVIGGFDERTFPAISVEAMAFAGFWARGWSTLVDPGAAGIHRSGTMNSAPTLLSGPHIRHFLGARFQRLWAEVWADRASWLLALADAPGEPDSPESIVLALELAQARRVELPQTDAPPIAERPITNPDRTTPAPTSVTPEIKRRLIDAERAVIDDYTRWLIDRDTEMTARYEDAYAAYLAEAARSAVLLAEQPASRREHLKRALRPR